MAEQKPFPPLSPSTLRTWGNTLPLSGTGQLTMDIAQWWEDRHEYSKNL
jgi:hypothetical protein